MTSNEMISWLLQFQGQKLWDKLYYKFNLKGFPMGETGTTMGGWYNKKIKNIEDFKGIKMRVPGLGGEVFSRLGATVLNMPGNEVVNALKLGVIDAAEWAGAWPDMAMGFHKVAKYYYGPGIHEPSTLNEFIINFGVWNSLTHEFKEIIKNACYANYLEGVSESFSKNAIALRKLKKNKNIQIANFPKEVVKEMLKLSNYIIADNTKNSQDYENIFKSWSETIKLFNSYNNFSEKKYLDYRTTFLQL